MLCVAAEPVSRAGVPSMAARGLHGCRNIYVASDTIGMVKP